MSWETVKLVDITINQDNQRKPLNERERKNISKLQLYPYIGANNVIGYVDEYLFEEEIICVAEDGGSWGKNQTCCVFVNEKCWVNNHAHVLKSNGKADLKYLMHYLNSADLNSYITGSTRGKLTKTSLDSIQIPLPPLATQKRIADILDAADALRRKDQELLKKYDELAQAIFIDMFGDPVKNEKGWEVKRIGEISKIKGGKRLPLGDKLVKSNTGLPYIKAGNIKSGKVNLSDLEYLLPETQRKIKNYTVKAGDVCVTIVGVNIGDVGIVPKELDGANLTENAAKIIVNDSSKLNNVYLSNFWCMPFIQSEIKKRAMAVGVPKLALFRIEEIEIIIPPYSDQIKFNRAIEIINEHFNMSFQNQINSTYIFDSLLQKAFKGELVA
jgi:type I restriction enzyme S subunit